MRNVSWWISIPASSPVGGLILLYILHSFSEGPWVGLSSSCPHSGDLFVDITLVGILPFPVLPLHALIVLPRIVSLYLDSCLQVCFCRGFGKETSWNSQYPLCCSRLSPLIQTPMYGRGGGRRRGFAGRGSWLTVGCWHSCCDSKDGQISAAWRRPGLGLCSWVALLWLDT